MTDPVKPVEVEKPQVAPWEEKYELKPQQVVAGDIFTPASSTKAPMGKAPWEQEYKEKPRVSLQPTTVSSDEGFLNKLIGVESGGNTNAKNPRSSATGLGQFTDGTWVDAVKAAGKGYTMEDRKDPDKAKEILRSFTADNRRKAVQDLGRAPSDVELYMYHFLGREAAGGFLKAPAEALATDYVSAAAARANPTIFYNQGKPATVASVLGKFKRKF